MRDLTNIAHLTDAYSSQVGRGFRRTLDGVESVSQIGSIPRPYATEVQQTPSNRVLRGNLLN